MRRRRVDPIGRARYASALTLVERSTRMAVQLGSVAPDFEADTTTGHVKFHDWIGSQWAILFSHPKDFTPVCTTELGTAAKMKPDFDKRNAKMIAISVDDVTSHKKWIGDIEDTQKTTMNFPIIGDAERKVSKIGRASCRERV